MKKQFYYATLSLFLAFFGLQAKSPDEAGSFSKDELKKILVEVLQENPELIANAKDQGQKRSDFKKRKKSERMLVKRNMDQILSTEGYPIIGNPSGEHKIIVFLDPQCGHCHQMIQDMLDMTLRHPSLQIVMRDMPFLGERSDQISKLHILAYQQGKLPMLLKELFAATGDLNQNQIEGIAVKIGLKMDGSDEDMKEIKLAIEKSQELATALNIDSVPTFIIQDRIYRDYHGLEPFERLVKKSFLRQNVNL
jgi:protein-disulfide isomerase